MNEDVDLSLLFNDAYDHYVVAHSNRGDRPCFFGHCGTYCINTESDAALKPSRGHFMTHDWLPGA